MPALKPTPIQLEVVIDPKNDTDRNHLCYVANQPMGDLYSTHLMMLAAGLAITTGPVLEIGCGHYSTPLLHGYCAARGRLLHTVETDLSWGALFTHLATDQHTVNLDPDWTINGLPTLPWSLVFIDGKTEMRLPVAEAFIDTAVLVLHDVEDGRYGFGALFDEARGLDYYIDRTAKPWSALVAKALPEGMPF